MTAKDEPFAALAEALLTLEQLDETTFRSEHGHNNSVGMIFGGQFVAQALLAAQRTTGGWPAHSCSAYFLRPGNMDSPTDYSVEIVRDGRSFANRRVVASQAGKVLFDMLCSFHQAESGPSHQAIDIAGIPGPDDLPDLQDYLRSRIDRIPQQEVRNYYNPLPVQFRLVDADRIFHLTGKPEATRDFWIRFPPAQRIAELERHQPLIGFISDFWIGPVANELHSPPYPEKVPVFTVSHTLSFHAPARADEWLLFRVESPFAGEGLGFTRGMMFDRAGQLVASATQEVLMRR
ncbi:MAG: thioesterase family protein [Novosphingobium sp.]|nr:thioesterase family protein [Novosphingobium sp.]